MGDSTSVSDSINDDRANLNEPQEILYVGVKNAQRELANSNNKYALVLLRKRIKKVEEIVSSPKDGVPEYNEDVLDPIDKKCGKIIVDSGRPTEKEVDEIIGNIRYAINKFYAYNSTMVGWHNYID